MVKEPTAEEIRAKIASSRLDFANGIEDVAAQVNPKALKRNVKRAAKDSINTTKEALRMTASDALKGFRGFFVDELGIRWNNVGTVLLIGVGVASVAGLTTGIVNATNKR